MLYTFAQYSNTHASCAPQLMSYVTGYPIINYTHPIAHNFLWLLVMTNTHTHTLTHTRTHTHTHTPLTTPQFPPTPSQCLVWPLQLPPAPWVQLSIFHLVSTLSLLVSPALPVSHHWYPTQLL